MDKTPKISNIGVKGLIREAAVDSSLIPDTAVLESTNWNFDRIGVAQVRPGITGLGSTIATGYPILGLHNAQSGTAFAAISQGGSMRVYAYPSSSWSSSLTGGTANITLRALEAGGRTVLLNFGSASNMYSSVYFLNTSESWVTTGNPINPQAITDQVAGSVQPKYGEVYKSRIYLVGGDTNGSPISLSRLWFSNVISATGNFAWTPSTDYVDINPGDGEIISGLKRYSLELVVFKPNYMYRFKTSGVDPDPLIKIGTRSNESIVEGTRGLYFHHDTGFYQYTGGYPTKLSQPIVDIVQNIPYSQFASIVGWNDADHIYWSVGNVTIPETYANLTIKNCVLRYTESSGIWTVYSYAQGIKRGISFNNGTTLSRLVGLDIGVVATLDSGFTDLGEPIKYRMKTKWYDFGEISTRKILQEFAAVCEKAQASEIAYQVDEDPTIRTFGELKKMVNYFPPKSSALNIRFHRIRFIIQGTARFDSPIFRSIEMLNIQEEGVIKE